jgi:hypothetical protein
MKAAIKKFFSGVGCWGSLIVVLASLFWFGLACITPAMVFDKDVYLGYEVLLMGWMGAFLGQFAWFANLFWLLSLFLAFLRRWILTLIAVALALFVASDAFSFIGANVPLDEANVNSMTFLQYHVGFYFWLVSLAIVGLGAVAVWMVQIFWRIKQSKNQHKEAV